MEPNNTYTMEDFLKEAKDTLKSVNKATNLFKWLFAGILAIMMVMVVDTRVEVVSKADAATVQQIYITKKNANTANKLVQEQMKDMLYKYSIEDSTLDLSVDYDWIRDAIFDINYRGVE